MILYGIWIPDQVRYDKFNGFVLFAGLRPLPDPTYKICFYNSFLIKFNDTVKFVLTIQIIPKTINIGDIWTIFIGILIIG